MSCEIFANNNVYFKYRKGKIFYFFITLFDKYFGNLNLSSDLKF